MKKRNSFFKTTAVLVFTLASCFLMQTCDSWMSSDNFFTNIEDEVKVANAAQISVYMRYASTTMGTTSPQMETTEKVDVPFSITAVTTEKYGFYKWAAFSTKDFPVNTQYTSFVYNDSYATTYAAKELDESIVEFADASDASTTVTIHAERADIWIVPVCVERPAVNLSLPSANKQGIVRNMTIRIIFTKAMNSSYFYTTNDDGTTTLSDNVKINQVIGAFTDNPDNEDISSYFTQSSLSSTKKILLIKLKNGSLMAANTNISVSISKNVCDVEGYQMASDYSLSFTTGSNSDSYAPVLEVVEGGYTDCTSFACTDTAAAETATSVITNSLYTTELKQQRTTGKVQIYVFAKDISESDTTGEAGETDVNALGIQATCMVDAQGSASTKTIAATTIQYASNTNDSSLEGTVKGLTGGRTNGYLFTYDVSSLPDGLVKIDIWGIDSVGNTGIETSKSVYTDYANGYKSIFVVKDTTAPDVSVNSERITSTSSITIGSGNWFNSTTCSNISFVVADKENPILDTACGELQPSIMKWRFGTSKDALGAYATIDQTGANGYSLGEVVSASQDGALSFYVQLQDDLGNSSDVILAPLSIFYDNTVPTAPEIVAPVASAKIYPLTAVSGGGSGVYYTASDSLSLTVAATDPNYVYGASSPVSSGIAGFLIPTTAYSTGGTTDTTSLSYALTQVSNKQLSGLVSATWSNGSSDSRVAYAFATGDAENTTVDPSKVYYLYTVDNALNAKGTTTLKIVHDAQGPRLVVTDKASCAYNAGSAYYVSSDSRTTIATALSAGVQGVVPVESGTYYINSSASYIPLFVSATDPSLADTSSAVYGCGFKDFWCSSASGTKYTVSDNGSTEIDVTPGTNLTLAGEDNLGNQTVSAAFSVVKDTAVPVVTKLVLYDSTGLTALPIDSSKVASTNRKYISAQFTISDTQTGIRTITFAGGTSTLYADFSDAVLTVDGTTFVAGTNGTGVHSKNTFTFNTALSAATDHVITVTNIILYGEGEIVIGAYGTDPTGNTGTYDTAYGSSYTKVNCDSTAPAVSDLYFYSTAGAKRETYFNKTVPAESLKIEFTEGLSGVKYVNVAITNSSDPFASSTFAIAASGTDSTTAAAVSAQTASALTLSTTNYPVSLSGGTMTLTLSNVTIGSTEGTKTVTVTLTDAAGNTSAAKTCTIDYDVSGPAIDIDDSSSCAYSAGKYYRTSDTEVTKAATATNNAVTGLVAPTDTYYYGSSQTGVPFTVTLADDDTGCRNGLYYYVTGVAGTTYESGKSVTLAAGTYTITAKDYLGNETVTPNIVVKQDTAVPVADSVLITGTASGESSTEATTVPEVTATIVVHDTEASSNDTGVRSLTLSGDATFGTLSVTAGGTSLTSGTDFTYTTGTNTVTIYLTYSQQSLTTYVISGISLTSTDGTKTLKCDLADATGNVSAQKSDTIFADTTKPTLTSITPVSTDKDLLSGDSLSVATNDTTVTMQLSAHDETSGIKRIYITNSASVGSNGIPTGTTLLSSTSTVSIGGTAIGASVAASNAYITLTDARIASTDETISVTDVSLPTATEGAQPFHAVIVDNSNLACADVTETIIYDKTAPSFAIDTHSSYVYSTASSMLTTQYVDSSASITTDSNNMSGVITGLVSGTYYYSGTDGFKFSVSGTNDTVSGASAVTGYYGSTFTRTSSSGTASASGYTAGSADYTLAAGTYTISAEDGIGNARTSGTITVAADTIVPVVSGVSFYNSDCTTVNSLNATNNSAFGISFDVNDTTTGIRSLAFSGTLAANGVFAAGRAYSTSNTSGYRVFVGSTEYTYSSTAGESGNTYYLTTANGVTALYFNTPIAASSSASTIKIESLSLTNESGSALSDDTYTFVVTPGDCVSNTVSADAVSIT